jgi:hypothetical protein
LTSYYTKTAADYLLNTIRTTINNTNIDLTAPISVLGNKSDKSTTYTMIQVNNLLNTKLNNSTGAVSTCIKHKYGTDVAMFYHNASKDVELKGNCLIYIDLSVLTRSLFNKTLSTYVIAGGGGAIRVIPSTDGLEASIGYYSLNDSRAVNAGEMWVSGISCWSKTGYSIGTSVKHSCLNINTAGDITIPYILNTSNIIVHNLNGSSIVCKCDNTDADLPCEITMNRTITNGTLYTAFGVGGSTDRGAFWYYNGRDRITINSNGVVNIDGNLIVNGTITNNTQSLNPFWICGKISANGSILFSNRGKYLFTCVKSGVGTYTISPTNDNFPDTNYIVNVTCQVDGASASARINSAAISTSSIIVITYVNNVTTDCIFNFPLYIDIIIILIKYYINMIFDFFD